MNIILFDGLCNLCNSSVQFIIKHDTHAHFHFASQQSKIGQTLLKKYHLESIESIILISNQEAYLYSNAALKIARELDGYWRFLTLFRFVPQIFRDLIYKRIAKYRYKFFGKKESCMIPTPQMQSRFLE